MSWKLALEVIEREGVIVWAKASQWSTTILLDRSITQTESEIKSWISSLMEDPCAIIHNWFLTTKEGTVLQLGHIIPRGIHPTSSSLSLTWSIKPNKSISALRDDGTIWKSNWRFQMLRFAEDIFPNGIPQKSKTILLPWMWDEEHSMWSNLWSNYSDMIMVEWDMEKAWELRKKFQSRGLYPTYVNNYLGSGGEGFAKDLIETIWSKPVSILSLDTESAITQAMYEDLLWIILNLNIQQDCLLSLNFVRRWSVKLSRELLDSFSKKFNRDFNYDDTVTLDFLKHLPEILLLDSCRDDICIWDVKVNSYLWWSATSMDYLFAHIKRK